jgi:uncharacterized protein (DUF305 family)
VWGRRRGWVIVLVLLAASCRGPAPHDPGPPAITAVGQTDVWFMQHMVPHLWQASSIASLTRDKITHPRLARLADAMTRRDEADINQLQGWLALQGLAPHGHSHQRVDNRRQSDLERLSQLGGAAFDLAFLQVMAARDHAGITMAATEVGQGTSPELRRFAQQMLAAQQAEIRQLDAWNQAWSTTASSHREAIPRRSQRDPRT